MSRLRPLLPALGLIALIGVFFWKQAFTNLIIAQGDTFLYFYPYWEYRGLIMRAGQLPLWNPYLFMGVPFLANSQAGVLYPLNWPVALLSAPLAMKASLLAHLALATTGAYVFARRVMRQAELPAFVSAAVFGLSGYLSAQTEHINQLQGLAWFPWLLWMGDRAARLGPRRGSWPAVGLSGLVLALQLLSGHTQSAFISLTGLTVFLWVRAIHSRPASPTDPRPVPKFGSPERVPALEKRPPTQASEVSAEAQGRRPTGEASGGLPAASTHSTWALLFSPGTLWLVALTALIAGLIASAQILPTLELSRLSLRGAGLPLRDAVSFSLTPLLIGRALLPGYSRALASEFVAYTGVIALGLSLLGAAGWRGDGKRTAMIALVLAGLFLALGGFNPLYRLLALLPPFNLFRAPARWLFLFAFGSSMLAGYGLEALRSASWPRSKVALAVGVPALLMAWSLAASGVTAPGETGALGLPSAKEWGGWLLAALALAAALSLGERGSARTRQLVPAAVSTLLVAELFFASRQLAYNQPTFPEAYSGIRPAMTQLLAAQEDSTPPGRFLSMSALRFDPGDLPELRSAWDSQLPADAVYQAIVATKAKEVLSPNLPLAWRIPSVDGFDGGILPLADYTRFEALFLPPERITPDGRLRENLTQPPANRVLQMANARYLITDKVGDAWVDGVYFDLQFSLDGDPARPISIDTLPGFKATAIGLVLEAALGDLASNPGTVRVKTVTGGVLTLDLPAPAGQPALAKVSMPEPSVIESIEVLPSAGALKIQGVTLIDERTGAFQSLTLGPYRLVHSGDVKIYENLAVLPRAYWVGTTVIAGDDAGALAALSAEGFAPSRSAVLQSGEALDQPGATGVVSVSVYEPERVVVTTGANAPGYLILSDAHYPGWEATVDGQPAVIQRANVMFRAVAVPAGEHQVEFRYRPRSLLIGVLLSGVGLLILMVMLGRGGRRTKG